MLRIFGLNKLRAAAIFFALPLFACSDEYTCPIPNIDRFTATANVPMGAYRDVTLLKSCGYLNHGIIVYLYSDGEAYAFDATCPTNADCMTNGLVVFDGQGYVTGTCHKCKVQYNLTDGKSLKSKVMLRPYIVQRLTTTEYRVSNY